MTAAGAENSPIQSHFESATHIPHAETEHFDRSGFSGDIFVPKQAEMGFTALQVEVDGAHPRKEILKGTTRSYYVVAGEGTFRLNDQSKVVRAGDLVVIPPENDYDYDGKMTLFEFNISPTNSFQDKLVTTVPAAVEPSAYGIAERKLAYQLREERRHSMASAIAQLLRSGYTLTNKELATIVPYYGYSPQSPIKKLVGSHGFSWLVSTFGTQLEITKYKGREIYHDRDLRPEETDIAATKGVIDGRLADMVAARQQGSEPPRSKPLNSR